MIVRNSWKWENYLRPIPKEITQKGMVLLWVAQAAHK